MNVTNHKSSTEIPTGSVEDVIISSAGEFKRKLKISSIPDVEIKEFFKEPISFSSKELKDLRAKYMNDTPNDSVVVNFLRNKKLSIIESTRTGIDDIKKVTSNFSKAREINEKGNDEQSISIASAEKLFEQTEAVGQKMGGEVSEAISEGTKKAKEVGEKIVKGGYSAQLGTALEDSFSKLKNFDIWGAIVSLFKGIFGMFVGSEAIKDAGEKIKEKIDINSPEYKETVNQAQDKVISYLEKATGKPLDEETKTKIRNKISPNAEGSYISTSDFKILMEKVASGKGLSFSDITNTSLVLNILSDKDFIEMKEILSQSVNKKIFLFLKTKFEAAGISFDENKEKLLKGIIKEEFEKSTINEIIEETKENGGKVHFDGLEGIEGALGIGVIMPKIIFSAYEKDIIKAENLAIGVVESGKDTISIGIKSLLGEDIMPDLVGRLSWDNFDDKLSNLSPEKKIFLERAFYAELGLVTAALGTIGFYGTSSIVSLIEGTSNITAGKNFITSPVQRLEKTLNIIGPGKGSWLKEIEFALKDTKRSYEIVNKLKAPNLSERAKKDLFEELGKISNNFTNTKTGIYSTDTLSKITKNLNPLQTFHFNKSLNELKAITDTNTKLGSAIINGTFTKEALKAKQFYQSFKIKHINGRAIINITEGLKAKEFAKALGTLSPEFVKGLFRVAPVFILSSTIYESVKKQDGNIWEAICKLNPISGASYMFKQTEVDYNENGLKIKNPGSFAGGIAIVGTELVFIGKDIARYGWKGIPIGAFNSFFRIPVEGIRGIGWASVRGFELFKTTKGLLKKVPKKGAVRVGVSILFGAVCALEYASSSEISTTQLEKDGILNNGDLNLELLKQKWNGFSNNKKEEIINIISISSFGGAFSGKSEKFNFKLESGTYKITVDKELKNQEVLIKDLSEDVSRFLTDMDSNIKLDIQFD